MGFLIVALLAALATPQPGHARERFIEGGPQSLAGTRSLGDLIRSASAPIHISFVHGMRAEEPGSSAAFRAGLLRRFGGSASARVRRFLDLGDRPPEASVGAALIWETDEAWAASRPFVDRHTLRLTGGAVVVVDEVNWWPLLFPIKCRFLVLPEHDLSGNEDEHLRLCAGQGPEREAALYHPWLTREELDNALRTRPRSGGGARANGALKRQIFNWGLADAVIALGPMRHYLTMTMQRAFAIAVEGVVAGAAEDRVLIAESLGSFVVLDSIARDTSGASGAPAVNAYLDRTNDIYFFANQFALLEFGRIANIPPRPRPSVSAPADPPSAPAGDSPLAQLQRLARADLPNGGRRDRHRLQIIALSDPSDLLTYRVPEIENATVVNIYVRNANPILFGSLANPMTAHTGHVANPAVWDVLLRPHTE
ncbi:MAG TPA: hypothetical protein VES64_04625 [Allosphingosinicella sp.]|nr:hypothetical protein [Allosphingosinicella sp.]